MKKENLSGAKFGKLLVINRVEDYVRSNGARSPRYMCVCSCGSVTVVRGDSLKSGRTVSCGKCKQPKKEREGEATREDKEKTFAADCCCFFPKGVMCDEIKCSGCGWNPYNEELRRERVGKLLRGAKNDKSNSAAEDS